MYPTGPPSIAVTIPQGMPVGPYQQYVRVIEKNDPSQIWEMFNNSPEVYSDPWLLINFTVRESRVTGNSTPNTATNLDNLLPPTGAAPFEYSSQQPAIVRDPFGSLVLAFASDRPQWVPPFQPNNQNELGQFSLYFGTMANSAKFNSFGVSNTMDAASPLSDLNSFTPASNTRWFSQALGPYPAVAAAPGLFGVQAGETIVGGTVAYGNPTFPTAGLTNPFNPIQTFTGMLMAFTGTAQKQTSSGRIGLSQLFMTTLTSGQGSISIAAPTPMGNDQITVKGKPSVLQTPNGAMVFYPGTSGSNTNLYYSLYTGNATPPPAGAGFSTAIPLPFGGGFASVTSASASGRVYQGVGSFKADGVTPILKNGDGLLELTFSGQLQGRPNPEIFLGRMKVDNTNYWLDDDAGNRADGPASDGNLFLDFGQRVFEPLVATGQRGVFRAVGVLWDQTQPIQVAQVLNGAQTNLLVTGTGVLDRETGVIAYDSNLGGKMYIETNLGTVRIASTNPAAGAHHVATYTPRLLRVSTGVSGYTKPTGLYDNREISNPTYWRRASGTGADFTDDIRTGRFTFTYNQASGGPGLPARPYYSSARFGVQLPFRIAVDQNGNPLSVVVAPNGGPATHQYQIDPAKGEVYFTALDEDAPVSITYTALSESGGVAASFTWNANVGIVPERGEQQILIDNPVNESDLTSFLDPFSFVGQRRPPLVWLFWTSTRLGVPDIYFETISPQWSPVPTTGQ